MKKVNRFSLFHNKIAYAFTPASSPRLSRVSYTSFSEKTAEEIFQKEPKEILAISDLTISVCYYGLLVKNSLRRDYPKELYSEVERALKIPADTLSKKVLDYLAKTDLEGLKDIDVLFADPSPELRFLAKCSCLKEGVAIFKSGDTAPFKGALLTYLKGKKVLLYSDHSSLFQVQFTRLKSGVSPDPAFAFDLFAVDMDKSLEECDRSNYVEGLDAADMTLLNYSFDVLLSKENVFSLGMMQFVKKLGVPAFVLNDGLYSWFDIVKTNRELTGDMSGNVLSLEAYDTEFSKDFIATEYLSKHHLKKK